MFFTRSRKVTIASTTGRRHRASTSSVAATPILAFKKISRSATKVAQWWNNRKPLHDPLRESLPSCGFFTPSASYIPVTDTSAAVLPWTTSMPPESDSTDTFTGHGSILGRTGGPTASGGCVHSRRRAALIAAQSSHPYMHTNTHTHTNTPFREMHNVTDLAGEEQAIDKITKANTEANAKRPLNLKHIGYQPLDLKRRANKVIKRRLVAKIEKKDEGAALSCGRILV